MNKISSWSNEEIKTLFKFVEIKKQEGMPLVKIFSDYANRTRRQANSVRNYYYKELSNMINDSNYAMNFEVNLNNHVVIKSKPFSKEEESRIIKQIDDLKNNGYSVRKACLKLSGGDVAKMIRMQNKYRAVTKNQNDSKHMGEIIKMPVLSPKISDEEIKALFMGLVKLVKKQESELAKSFFEEQVYNANQKLKEAMMKLAKKQEEINSLKKQIMLTVDSQSISNKRHEKHLKIIADKNAANLLLKHYFFKKKTQKVEGEALKK